MIMKTTVYHNTPKAFSRMYHHLVTSSFTGVGGANLGIPLLLALTVILQGSEHQ